MFKNRYALHFLPQYLNTSVFGPLAQIQIFPQSHRSTTVFSFSAAPDALCIFQGLPVAGRLIENKFMKQTGG